MLVAGLMLATSAMHPVTAQPSSEASTKDHTSGDSFLLQSPTDFLAVDGDVAVADVNGDENLDFAIAGSDATFNPKTRLYLGDGSGAFTEASANLTGVFSTGTALFGDVNSDDNLDLIISGQTSSGSNAEAFLHTGDGTGGFTTPDTSFLNGHVTSLRDVNGDDKLDLITTEIESDDTANLKVFLGDGSGGFNESSTLLSGIDTEPPTTSLADVNGDNQLDLLVSVDLDPSFGANYVTRLYLGDGEGGFSEASANLTSLGEGDIAIEDFDNDGNRDLILSGESDQDGDGLLEPTTVVYRGDGAGGFTEVSSSGLESAESSSVSIADINEDGNLDLFLTGQTNNGEAITELYLGNDDITFTAFTQVDILPFKEGGHVFGDVDGDGNPGLLIAGTSRVGPQEETETRVYINPGRFPLSADTENVFEDGVFDFGRTGVDLDISGVSGSGQVTVNRFDDAPSNSEGITEDNVSKYRLTISAVDDLSFNSAQLRLAVSEFGGINDPTQVTIYKRDTEGTGEFDSLETTVGTNGTPDDISDDSLYATTDSFSEFVLASDSEPLPVELAGFDATTDDNAVQLSWSTASETNNAEFQVQRRLGEGANGQEGAWKTVGSVEGSGTTSQVQSYRFTDADLPYEADALTYRLRQVDTDGSAHLSETITVERGVTEVQLLGTSPNPAQQRATVRYALPEKQKASIRLYDILGRRVRTVANSAQEGRHQRTLDVGSLPSGVYFLRLRAGGETRTQKLTIVR